MALTLNSTTGISGVDGSNSSPAVQGSDNNTGLSFATDTVNIATGGATRATIDSAGALDVPTDFPIKVNGSEKLRITSSGNLGLSTTSPVAQTQSDGTALTPVLDLKGTGSVTNASGVLQFTRKDNATQGSMIYNSGDDAGLTMRNTDGNGMGFYNGTTLALRVDSSGKMYSSATYTNTTSNSANVSVPNSDGQFYRSTSSIKYKDNVTTLTDSLADKILNCRPVSYTSKCSNDDKTKVFYGLIAEEVDKIDQSLVFYNNETETPEPEGVQYDRFVPALINLVNRQKAKIEALEARVTTLEAG